MKQFVVWLAIAVVSYAGLAGAYHAHLGANPRRVVVVVDSSNAMRGMLPRVDALLDEIAADRYQEFALFTDRSRIHGWSSRFSPGRITPYGPRDLSRLAAIASRPEVDEAQELILITNATPDETASLSGWTIRRLE